MSVKPPSAELSWFPRLLENCREEEEHFPYNGAWTQREPLSLHVSLLLKETEGEVNVRHTEQREKERKLSITRIHFNEHDQHYILDRVRHKDLQQLGVQMNKV